VAEYEKKRKLAQYYADSLNYEKLRLTCLDALKDRPRDPWMLSALSHAYYNLCMYDECIGACLDAIAHGTSPYDRAYDYDRLALTYSIHLGDHAKGEEYARIAVEGQPGTAVFLAHYALEIAHGSRSCDRRGRIGRMRKALALFKRAEAIDPGNYLVLHCKSILYRNYFRDRKAEAEILARMVAVSGDPHRTNCSLAAFHEKYGEFDEAHAYYAEALKLRPDIGESRDKLNELVAMGSGRTAGRRDI
jgi:tetratricopeptide (TPR) repeat protein